MKKYLIGKLRRFQKLFIPRTRFTWIVANIDKSSKLGFLLSIEHSGPHSALPDIWNEEEGWIKWNIKGYNYKEIDKLKDNIIKAVYCLKPNDGNRFFLSYSN